MANRPSLIDTDSIFNGKQIFVSIMFIHRDSVQLSMEKFQQDYTLKTCKVYLTKQC